MSTATVRTGIDAFAASDRPTSNYGTLQSIRVKDGSPQSYAFIWFKNPAPRGATILSATLRLYGVGNWGASVAVTLQRIAAGWKESQITWNNKPGVTGSTVTVTQTNPVDATEWAFDVTAILQTITDGAANYGFRLTTTSTTRRLFYSLNAGSHLPVLDVTWSDAPDAPHTLSPSGGRAVSLAKPTLRFDFVDVSGSTLMAACQVQINHGSATFASPTFDSGTVATSDPDLDLTTTAYAGLSAGTVAYWRVRVQDAAGLWSTWSDAASFTRTAQGTLTLDNPAVSPNDYVNDVTPEIFWTLTSATQEAWRVVVALDSDPTHYLLDTGRRTGTGASYTLPKGVLTDQGATYRLTVLTWDTVDREATPGDSAYLRVVRAFTFAEDATPNPVTSLAVAQVADRPWMALTWSRSTAPDAYTVVRDGVTVDSGLDPADLFTTGTSYRYVDKDAAPHRSHTWKVQAVVNGKSSTSNPTVTAQYDISAVWLVDLDSDTLCPILPTDSATFDMPDVAAVYEPVGARAVVRIVQAQRGLEGSISGRIIDYAGSTAATWSAALLAFKRRPSNELRLIIGAQALRVIVGNVVVAPLSGGNPDDRAVSFSFWSLDGPK